MLEARPIIRISDQIEAQLKATILAGDLAKGARLPSETALAAEFGASRNTVRQALRSLNDAGLITTSPGATGGSFVCHLDHHDLADEMAERIGSTLALGSISYQELTEFRALVEVPAAGLAALHRTERQLTQLRDSVERARILARSDSPLNGAHIEFHRLLAEAAGNRILSAFLTAASTITLPTAAPPYRSPEISCAAVAEHTRILEAVADRNADEARRLARAHLESVQARIGQLPPRDLSHGSQETKADRCPN